MAESLGRILAGDVIAVDVENQVIQLILQMHYKTQNGAELKEFIKRVAEIGVLMKLVQLAVLQGYMKPDGVNLEVLKALVKNEGFKERCAGFLRKVVAIVAMAFNLSTEALANASDEQKQDKDNMELYSAILEISPVEVLI